MYVISDRGELVTRYDERLLSNTKLSFMYTPGSAPITLYERLDVDGVLFSSIQVTDDRSDDRGTF